MLRPLRSGQAQLSRPWVGRRAERPSAREITVRCLGRVMISQWYTMISGLLLTAAAAALVFALVPPSYTSSGTVVVMPPTRPTNKPTNPLLGLDSNLDTVTLILLQSLSSPLLPFRVGLIDGQDSVTIKQGGIGSTATT